MRPSVGDDDSDHAGPPIRTRADRCRRLANRVARAGPARRGSGASMRLHDACMDVGAAWRGRSPSAHDSRGCVPEGAGGPGLGTASQCARSTRDGGFVLAVRDARSATRGTYVVIHGDVVADGGQDAANVGARAVIALTAR